MLNISNLNNKNCKFQNICYISTVPKNLLSQPLPWQNQASPVNMLMLPSRYQSRVPHSCQQGNSNAALNMKHWQDLTLKSIFKYLSVSDCKALFRIS